MSTLKDGGAFRVEEARLFHRQWFVSGGIRKWKPAEKRKGEGKKTPEKRRSYPESRSL